jgi:small subunit ribosomal protein S17
MEENKTNPSEEQVEETPAEAAPAEPVSEAPAAAAPEPEAPAETEVAAEAESESAAEPVAETAPEETASEPAAEPETGAETPEAPPAPAQPSRKARSRRHVPRHERRPRTGKATAKKKPAKRGARKPIVRLPKPESEPGSRQERRGVVVSAAMDKTIVVKVDTIKAHKKYRKVMRRSKKFHAHDEANSAKVGDVVRIVETRPLSATKRWRVIEIVEAAK